MARDYFDSKGKHRGTSVSRKDSVVEKIQADQRTNWPGVAIVLLGVAILISVLPLMFFPLHVFTYLEQNVHTLFCLIASGSVLSLSIYLLFKFRLLRAMYVCLIGVLISAMIFHVVTDYIWATFIILIVMGITFWVSREIYAGRLLDV